MENKLSGETYENGSNFLPHKLSGSRNIIICHEVDDVLDILDTKGQTHADTERAVIIDIKRRKLIQYHSLGLNESIRRNSRRKLQRSQGAADRWLRDPSTCCARNEKKKGGSKLHDYDEMVCSNARASQDIRIVKSFEVRFLGGGK